MDDGTRDESFEDSGLGIVTAPRRAAEAPPKRKRRWIIPVAILVGLIVVAAIALGGAAAKTTSVLNSIQRNPALTVDEPPPVEPGQPVNVVILGSDTRGDDQGRSDVLMLAHLTADRTKLYLVSFPRDMYVAIPGHGENKINAAYAFGGPALTIKTLNQLVGVEANHAAEVDFQGFIELSDIIGGVTVNNDVSFSAGEYTFPKGPLDMSGAELLAYVRERHNVPKGDLDRAHHQRMVLKAMVGKIMSKGVLTDVPTLLALADRIGQFVTVDDKLTNDALITLVTSLQIDGASSIIDLQAPITGFGRSPAGASIDIVDKVRIKELATALQQDTMDVYVDKYGTGF